MTDDSDLDPDAQIAAAQALLSHVYWVCDDLASRIESFNQRAGVILAASVAIVAVGIQSLPMASWLLTGTALLPWALPIGAALYTLTVTSTHGIGPAPIRPYVGRATGPDLSRGQWMARELLNSLTSPAGNKPSVVEGLNHLCKQKAWALRATQACFVLALVASLTSGAKWAVVHALVN